jgi:hypothetical protein
MLTYKLDALPDLSLNGSVSHYEHKSMASFFAGTYWTATVGVDFSKWLRPPDTAKGASTPAVAESAPTSGPNASRFSVKSPIGDKPSLKVFYRYTHESAAETAGAHSSDSHLFGAALSGRL